MEALRVSVIMTVYNERQQMQRLLDSLAAQTRPPDEVVICDGGSQDGTIEAIQAYIQSTQHQHPSPLPRIKLLVKPGANISQGRNHAIAAAAGPIIAVTDAGVRLDQRWLEELVAGWGRSQESGVRSQESGVRSQKSGVKSQESRVRSQESGVNDLDTPLSPLPSPLASAGFFLPDVEGVFLTAMAATVLPMEEEIDPLRFLPSSRSVAFLKSAWREAGGYPEWLDYCEDLVFDLNLKAIAPNRPAFVWRPQARVYFRPRQNVHSFWTQYYRYARGDGKADLWRKRHAIRYFTYLVAIPALLGHAFWGFFARWLGWAGLLVGLLLYCWRPWQRLKTLGAPLSSAEKLQAAAWLPIIRVVGDLAKMVGYPVGLCWRWQNRHRKELAWRKEKTEPS